MTQSKRPLSPRGELELFERETNTTQRVAEETKRLLGGRIDPLDKGEIEGWTAPYYAAGYAELKRRLGPLEGKRILHVACRGCTFVHFLNQTQKAQAQGIDSNGKYVQAGRNVGINGLSVNNASYMHDIPDRHYHAVLCHHFLYSNYLNPSDEQEIIARIHDKLADKGLLVIDHPAPWAIEEFTHWKGKKILYGRVPWKVLKAVTAPKRDPILVLQKQTI